MDAPDQIRAKRRVNGAVAFDPGQRRQGRGPDGDVEMRLPAFAPATMAAMAFAVITHDQFLRLKGLFQQMMNFLCNFHFFLPAPSNRREKL